MQQSTIQSIITGVSALAASTSAYFASRTLIANNAARRAEFETGRPYFTFFGYALENLEVRKGPNSEIAVDPYRAFIKGMIANRGRRRATRVSGLIFIFPQDGGPDVRTFRVNVGDDFPPGSEWEVKSDQFEIIDPNYLEPDVDGDFRYPGFLICVGLEYSDPLASNSHVDAAFLNWRGLSGGVVSGDLVAATGEERDALIARYGSVLSRYISA